MTEIETKPNERTRPDPKALTSEYHKAHKQVMLWAGILLIWEFVGVDLDRAKEAGGNVGALVKSIKSPQAVPWVLLILVVYFLFKVSLEWYQCVRARRMTRVAKADFLSGWIVALLAVALYVGQTLSKAQLADSRFFKTQITSASFAIMMYASQALVRRGIRDRDWFDLTIGILGSLVFVLPGVLVLVLRFKELFMIPIFIGCFFLLESNALKIIAWLKERRPFDLLDS